MSLADVPMDTGTDDVIAPYNYEDIVPEIVGRCIDFEMEAKSKSSFLQL
jgi:hypothetical protein